MPDIPLVVLAEDTNTITFGWNPVAGAVGYRFSRSSGGGKFSHTWDPLRRSVRFSKDSDWYLVEAMSVAASGRYSKQPVGVKSVVARAVAKMPINISVRGGAPAVGRNEGRLAFLNYSGSNIWNFVSGNSLTQWQKDHWDHVEQFTPWWDPYTDDVPSVMYIDVNAVYKNPDGSPQLPQYVLKDANNNYVQFYGNTEYLTDPGNDAWWDSVIAACQTAITHGYIGAKFDDVNLGTIMYSTPLPPINPRTPGVAYTTADWNSDFADGLTRCRQELPDSFFIIHNSVWWRHPLSNADILRAAQQADMFEHERGFIGNNDVSQLLAYCDQLHANGVKFLCLASGATGDTTTKAEFQLACSLLASDGGDWYMNEFQQPNNWWAKNDYDLGDALGPRQLISTSPRQWRRDFTGGYVTANESTQVGSVVLT